MTSHRNLKAAVRQYASEHSVTYIEARRLMGLSKLELDFIDEPTGIEVQVTVEQNRVAVCWFYPDGSQDQRESRTDIFLGLAIWRDSKRPALPADGTLEGMLGTHLESRIVDRIRTWLAAKITTPAAASVDDEHFVRLLAKPEDSLLTVVNLSSREAISHLVRLPLENPVDLSPRGVIDWHGARMRAADELAYSFLDRPIGEIATDRSLHLLHTGSRHELNVEGAREYHRSLLARDWHHPRPYGIDPATIVRWEIFEHRELLADASQEA